MSITFKLPPSPTPRPGERVVVFQGKTRFEGVFHGYNTNDDLLIRHGVQGILSVNNYLKVRLANPLKRQRGCWARLRKPNQIIKATAEQIANLDKILDTRITPGPTYNEFISEIWARGYEIFLVGGTVRDVLSNEPAKDVDLVTTIPFNLLLPLLEEMFGPHAYSRNPNNGFISVGLNAGSKKKADDPLMDVKNFFLFAPGTERAEFGSDLVIDQKLRDFACNAIYYDPINHAFLDPSGLGIDDAKTRTLNLINDTHLEHPAYKKANISLRYFKFLFRGFTPTKACTQAMVNQIKPLFSSMGHSYVVPAFQRLILGKVPKSEHPAVVERVKALMFEYQYEDIWKRHYEDRQLDLLGGGDL